jgi:hypothetical protein
MKSAPSNPSVEIEKDLSWTLFLAICAGFLLPLWLVGYCVVYTEGEVMHGMFRGLTVLAGLLVLIGFHRRKLAAAWVAGICGVLLIWQSWQIRKWAIIHEDVMGLVWHVQEFNRETGAFPESIKGYTFNRAWVEHHIMNYRAEGSKFGLVYFMNDPGTSYWYDSESGFGYYPD